MSTPEDAASRFEALFRGVYESFHRRDGISRGLSPASRGVLRHLALAGPITVGEAATHFERAQSATSELLTQLEKNGLVERRADEDDARRTYVWLTDAGRQALRQDDAVLAPELLATAFSSLDPQERERLLQGLALLLDNAPLSGRKHP